MKTFIKYILILAALFIAACWIFNHISAWGSIILVTLIAACWLSAKSDTIKDWFNDFFS